MSDQLSRSFVLRDADNMKKRVLHTYIGLALTRKLNSIASTKSCTNKYSKVPKSACQHLKMSVHDLTCCNVFYPDEKHISGAYWLNN